jgi:ribulose-phosphate 3-epimerase
MTIIAASILSADPNRLGEELAAAEKAGADWIHVDVMDGHFVPNLTMGPMTVEAVRRGCRLPVDAHLMIDNPDAFVEKFAKAGATHISVHAEASIHLNRTVSLIRSLGAAPGVALSPSTPLSALEWILEYVEYVLLLAVNPGFGGQDYVPNVLAKIRALADLRAARGLSFLIQSDGGINPGSIADFARAGVDSYVIGSAVFGPGDYGKKIGELRRLAQGAA